MSDTIITILTFLAYIAILLGIGIYSSRSLVGLKTEEYMDEFYTGGRGMGAFVVAMVLAAGLCSAGTFVGTPGLAYKNGLSWVVLTNWQNFMNLMVLGVAGKKIAIVARRINARSFLDIFGARYEDNKLVILIAGIAVLFFLVPYSSVQFIGGARMFEVMTGVSYMWGLVIMGIIVIVYTAIGGAKGASLASAIQGFVMTLSAILLFVFAVSKLGGVETTMRTVESINPELLQARAVGGVANPRYLGSFAVLFGIAMLGMPHGIAPAMSFKNSKAMMGAIVIGAISVSLWTILMATTGTMANAVDPALAVADQATPTMVMFALNPLLRGVVLAGVTAAMQSTVASMLLLISGSLLLDVYAKVIKPDISAEKVSKLVKPVTIGIGALAFLIAVYPFDALEFIVYFAIAGLESAFFAPLLLGLYWRKGNVPAALTSMICGLGSYILVAGFFKSLSFGMHPVVISLSISLIAYIAVALATPAPSRNVLQLYWGKYPATSSSKIH